MTGDLNNVVVHFSKSNPDKKENKDKSDDNKKSAGGGGGAGAGANSKHSVGEDQLRKFSPLLAKQGFKVENNGGGGNGAQGEGGGQNTYQLADGFGQLMNAGGVVYGGAEMVLKVMRNGNATQVIGNATGFGTQQAAQALKGTLGVVSKAGKILGVAGYGLQFISTGSKFVTGQDISKAEGVGFGISTVFVGAGVILSGTVAAPFVGAGALIYGAGQLGSYITTGKTLEENYYSK
jgi:hypothetical protein